MGQTVYKVLFLFFSVVILIYLAIPNPEFPEPLPGAKQSHEAADSETPLRRAYFTDFARAEVINHYKQAFLLKSFGVNFPFLRLNYPPEESRTLIRDQTKSTYLEEIVHPMRESIYINGFEPKLPKDTINIEGVHYNEKIIVRYVPSPTGVRVFFATLGLLTLYFVTQELFTSLKILRRKNGN